jgi:hypothetical protein
MNGYTTRLYADGARVPFPSYRCKARATFPWPASRDSSEEPRTVIPPKHHCKLHVDHDGDHKCICGKSWTRAAVS